MFFEALGEEHCGQITHVSADGADWIADVVAERCVNAVRCADPFHVVRWATDALDEVRRQAWNEARGAVHQRRTGRATRLRTSSGAGATWPTRPMGGTDANLVPLR